MSKPLIPATLPTQVPEWRTGLKALYLDMFNNWLTLESMAQGYGLELSTLTELIALGKQYHEADLVIKPGQVEANR